MKHSIGVYGLGVMGKNLSLNIASKGHTIAVFNRDHSKTHDAVIQSRKENITTLYGYDKVDSFVNSLELPRKIIVMVKAGAAVDAVIREIGEHINAGDIIVDGGNEWYENTERRQVNVHNTYGAYLLGMGVSGGSEGARNGPSLMPSGNEEAFREMEPILSSIAAKVDERSVCVSYIGSGGSGNYVKMVHNGIEYGVMQVIAEVYFIMKTIMKYSNEAIATFFERCNMCNYLFEITIDILRRTDGDSILDNILDSPKMNGTGTWTSKEGYEMCVPMPSIHSAVNARMISSKKHLRTMLSDINELSQTTSNTNNNITEDDLEKALITSVFLCYVQGFALLQKKNIEKQWGINHKTIADIWKGGCIIRNRAILDFFSNDVFDNTTDLEEELYMMKTMTSTWVTNGVQPLSKLVSTCSANFIAIPTISNSFQYILQFIQKDDPSNLIQAQRNYFGAHAFEKRVR